MNKLDKNLFNIWPYSVQNAKLTALTQGSSIRAMKLIQRWRGIAPLLFYGLLAFLALHQPLFHLRGFVAGQGVTDFYHFSWSYWWVEHAITTPDIDLYHTNYVIAPYTSNLGFHTLSLFWFPLWWAIKELLNPLAAFSLVDWVAFTLTGWATYVLLRRERVARPLALLGGVLLQLTPLMFMAAWWTTPNLLGQFWYPAHLLLWGEVVRRINGQPLQAIVLAILQGVALWAAALTDIQYILFLGLILIPYGVWTLWESRTRVRLAGLGLLAVGIFAALMWVAGPLPAMMEFDRDKSVKANQGMVWGIEFPQGFERVGEYWNDNAVGGVISLLVAVTLLWLMIGLIRRQGASLYRPLLWGLIMLLPLILSLGYEMGLGDQVIRLPYGYLHEPLGGTFRAPGRFGPIAVMAALLMIGITWTPYLRQRARWGMVIAPIGLLAILGHHHVFQSIPVQPAPRDYQIYHQMAAEPYDYVVIESPVAVGDALSTVGSPDNLLPQYYGSIHGKRMLTGHLSRAYLEYYWYLRTDDPLLSWLGQRRYLEPPLVEPELANLIPSYPIGYFMIRQDAIGLETTSNPEIIGYFNSLPQLLCPPIVEGPLVAFRTTWHPDGCSNRIPPSPTQGEYVIDIGAVGDERFLGWGWYWVEYPSGVNWRWMGVYPTTQLYLDLPEGEYQIEVAAQSFWKDRELRLSLNGEVLGSHTVTTDTLGVYSFTAPASLIGEGQHLTLNFDYDTPTIPSEVGQSADQRSLAVAVDWIRFTLVLQ